MIKIWLNGYSGMIGNAINKAYNPYEYELLNTDLEELDITHLDNVLNYGEINRPDIIINCVGMTNVEECENNREDAYRVNAIGARNLSIVAAKISAKLIHISTDDVFSGDKQKPFDEFDTPNPTSIYGKSKLAGENYVKELTQKHFIIRSSWVYGTGENFLTQVIEQGKKNTSLKIGMDQISSPTSANELAKFILYIMKTNEYGTYHVTCDGTCTRQEFTQEIFDLLNIPCLIEGVKTKDADLGSVHPSYNVLDNFILRILNDYHLPSWKDALKAFINKEDQDER